MVGILDPFTPGTEGPPGAGVDPGTYDRIRNEWGAFLSDPQGRAALMSAGLALTQPPSFGDNAMSQIGRAVGAMGQSGQLMEAQDLKRSELESKDAMREAQAEARLRTAGAAEQRAEVAGIRAGAAGDRAGYQMQRLEDARIRNDMSARLRAAVAYENYVKQTNSARLLDPSAPAPMSRDDFMRARGLGDLVQTPATGSEDDNVVIPPGADTTSRPAATGAPKPGDVRKGYRFKGGDPSKPESWEKV